MGPARGRLVLDPRPVKWVASQRCAGQLPFRRTRKPNLACAPLARVWAHAYTGAKGVTQGGPSKCADKQPFTRGSGLAACFALLAAAALQLPCRPRQGPGPIKIGFSMALTGPLSPQRQAGAARHEDLGGGDQRQGRAARAPGQARLLRRPDQCLDRARHLHQAHRRRQGRPRARPLRHQHGRAGDAGHHAEGQALHHPVRARCEPRVQVQQVLRHDPDRAEHQGVLHRGLLRRRRRAEPQAADGGAGRGRCGVLPQRLRGRARERQEARLQDRLRQDLSAGDDGLHADRARDPGDQSRTSSPSAPIRSTRSAWSRR